MWAKIPFGAARKSQTFTPLGFAQLSAPPACGAHQVLGNRITCMNLIQVVTGRTVKPNWSNLVTSFSHCIYVAFKFDSSIVDSNWLLICHMTDSKLAVLTAPENWKCSARLSSAVLSNRPAPLWALADETPHSMFLPQNWALAYFYTVSFFRPFWSKPNGKRQSEK